MDELDKNFDEKLGLLKLDLVSDLKKEIMNELKAILSEKDKEIKVLKSQVTLLQNHVSTVRKRKIKLTKNLRKFWKSYEYYKGA